VGWGVVGGGGVGCIQKQKIKKISPPPKKTKNKKKKKSKNHPPPHKVTPKKIFLSIKHKTNLTK
jgi:hypothetical protein